MSRPRPYAAIPLVRWGVQGAYALFLLLSGYEFARFYSQTVAGGGVAASRPPVVEAFLPISALLGVRRLFANGQWDEVHPAGLAILLGAIVGAFLGRKSFCSWVCPVGTVERGLETLGRKTIWKHQWPAPPRWLALALTAPKYLLLTFFAYIIFGSMKAADVESFVHLPYNLAADAKMLLFFETLSGTGIVVLAVLAALSLVVKHFWCRVLCPYGALLGLASWFSPLRVDRNESTCTNCQKCTRACPVDLRVHLRKQVVSTECTGCLGCVSACPEPDTLRIALPVKRRRVWVWLVPIAGIGALGALWIGARATGHWESKVAPADLAAAYRAAPHLEH